MEDRIPFIIIGLIGAYSVFVRNKTDSCWYYHNPGEYYRKIFGFIFPKGATFNEKRTKIVDTVALCLMFGVFVYGAIAPYSLLVAVIILCVILVLKELIILMFCRS